MTFHDQFIRSILGPSSAGGYNLFNTLILLGIALFVLLKIMWPILKKQGIKVDNRLVLASIPYLVFGTIIRAFEDFGSLPYSINPLELGFYTHTPGLWAMTGVLMLVSLLSSKKLFEKKGKDFIIPYGIFGATLLALSLIPVILNFVQVIPFLLTILMIATVSAIGIMGANHFVREFKGNQINYLAVIGQAVDGSSTFVNSTFFSCTEQHFVSRAIIDFFPLLFVIIKILFVIVLIYVIDKEIENENYRNYIKSIVVALGFMTGTRNLWNLALGSCG